MYKKDCQKNYVGLILTKFWILTGFVSRRANPAFSPPQLEIETAALSR